MEVAEINMAMAEDRKLFSEMKTGFDEMKHAVMTFIASHTNSTFPQSYGEFSYRRSHLVPPNFEELKNSDIKPFEYDASDKVKTPTCSWTRDVHYESVCILTKPPSLSLFGRQLTKSHLLSNPYTIPSPKR